MDITAIIPSYNYGHMIARAIDSALAQTYPLAEILVIDDGSTDNTGEVVARYGPPVRYIRRTNHGLSASRNYGLREARTEWVALLDADDYWLPEKTERQVREIERNPGAQVCYTGTLVDYERDQRKSEFVAPAPDELWPYLRYRNIIVPSSVLARRELFLSLNGFDEKLTSCEDWDMWVRLGENAGWAAAREALTGYRMSDTSMSANVQRMMDNTMRILEGTLLNGYRGLDRWLWRRRIVSNALFTGFITARYARQRDYGKWLLRSLRAWPSPFFVPLRYKTLLFELRHGFRFEE